MLTGLPTLTMRGHRTVSTDRARLGELVAAVLAGSWRALPPRLNIHEREIGEITPLLLGSGSASLAWWRIRCDDVSTSPAVQGLKQAYLLHTLRAAVHERDTVAAISTLRSAGVEPLLIKGWAVARLYPKRGLRPYGDMDVLIGLPQQRAARLALATVPRLSTPIDLHTHLDPLDRRGIDDLYAHSRPARLGDVEVRVLGPEHQLRLLCLHLLKHGGRRPLLLCDVGLMLESVPRDFDWDYCLGADPLCANWVVSVLRLAHEILGARLDSAPEGVRGRVLPDWVVPEVLRQWGTGMDSYLMHIEGYLRHPSAIPRGVRRWWPNGLDATVRFRIPIDEMPILSLQAARFLELAITLPARVVRRGASLGAAALHSR